MGGGFSQTRRGVRKNFRPVACLLEKNSSDGKEGKVSSAEKERKIGLLEEAHSLWTGVFRLERRSSPCEG